MAKLTQDQVRRRLVSRGLSNRQARIGSAIALCEAPTFTQPPESDFGLIGDQDLADAIWGFSYGGFQIRSLRAHRGTGKYRDEERLDEVGFNLDSAVTIFRESGWDAWSTFTSGMYKAYLPDMFPPPPGTYVVVAGDTLSGIAAKFKQEFTWQELARVNNLHDPYALVIGQTLLLPT